MDEKVKKEIEKLENASPLEVTSILQDLELYDQKSSQEIIDGIYEQFETGENIEKEVLKPVMYSVVDGLLEVMPGGKKMRKKGLTASRVLEECEQFSYDGEYELDPNTNQYIQKLNKKKTNNEEILNSNMSQEYNRNNYDDPKGKAKYKEKMSNGNKAVKDEITGELINVSSKNPDKRIKQKGKVANVDHNIPLERVHNEYKTNYALDDTDIKKIANIEDNYAIINETINKTKQNKMNDEFISNLEESQNSKIKLSEAEKKHMLELQKEGKKAIETEVNKTVANNIIGRGTIDEKAKKRAIEDFKQKNGGRAPTAEDITNIEIQLKKEKTKEIQKNIAKDAFSKEAMSQAKDMAVGNLMLFIIKPLYFEMADIFKNGMEEGVNVSSVKEALAIRFGRIKKHVVTHAPKFIGDNVWEFIKGLISSIIESIISLFVGVFKQILKIIKEGIKIGAQAIKILFGKNSQKMSVAEKGDAIIKLLGGSVIAIAGIGIESLLNKIGIGEPWSVVLSTMLSGIVSALFMYLLNKIDIFSVKAEKRYARICEIFEERIKDINEAAEACNVTVLETLKYHREEFEKVRDKINTGLIADNIEDINEGLYKMAEFMKVELQYSNTVEFLDFMDSDEVIVL